MDAVFYGRYSSLMQSEGDSIEVQLKACRDWVQAQGHQIIRTFSDEAISGKCRTNRPGLQAALEEIQSNRVLVVYSLSRLSRSTVDCIQIMNEIHNRGGDFHSCREAIDTSTAAGRMFFGMMSVLAEFERDLISERTSSAMVHMQRNGQIVGGMAPYGWRIDSERLVPDEHEQKIRREILEQMSAGSSFREIANDLNLRGLTKRNGSPWDRRNIQAMFSEKRLSNAPA
jgi:site-specific DNA recombinase